MLDLHTIQALADEQARRAARAHKLPYKPFDLGEIHNYPPFPFPNIGSFRPAGWALVDNWLVDKTGWGSPSEPALTVDQLKTRLSQNILDGHAYGYAFIEEGECQIVLGVFEQEK